MTGVSISSKWLHSRPDQSGQGQLVNMRKLRVDYTRTYGEVIELQLSKSGHLRA